MTSFTCKCGSESPKTVPDGSYNVGAMMKATGFWPIMGDGGGMTWICPGCVQKLVPHVQAIKEILGMEYINFLWLETTVERFLNPEKSEASA
jgi:hypothetical protein